MHALLIALSLTAGTPGVTEHVRRADDATAQYILTLRPSVGERQARRLGKIIDYWSDFYGVDPDLMVAILRVESNFQGGIRSCWQVHRYGRVEITCDLGIAQVNQLWIEKWGLDERRLQHDDAYGIQTAARILCWLRRYFPDDPDWQGRYHSGTPSKKASYLGKLEGVLAQRES